MKIKEMRVKMGYQQRFVAEQLGVEQAAVSKWESGRSCPELPKIPKLAELYNVTTDEIIAAITAAGNDRGGGTTTPHQ